MTPSQKYLFSKLFVEQLTRNRFVIDTRKQQPLGEAQAWTLLENQVKVVSKQFKYKFTFKETIPAFKFREFYEACIPFLEVAIENKTVEY